MSSRINPTRIPSLRRARFALYGTIGFCTYVSFQSFVLFEHRRQGVQKNDKKQLEFNEKAVRQFRDFHVCTRRNIEEGRYYTLVTSMFNHNGAAHFFANMLGLWSFGRNIAYGLGAGAFMTIFYGGGIVGNLFCLRLDRRNASKENGQRTEAGFVGASGGVSAILAANACFNPRGWMIIGFVPVQNLVGAFLFAGFSVWAQNANFQDNVAHLGHLGGLLFGFAWFFAKYRSFPRVFP